MLKEKYPQIAERIILMALESVNYAEDRATQILQIVQDEDEQRAQKQASANPKSLELSSTTAPDQVDGVAGDRYLKCSPNPPIQTTFKISALLSHPPMFPSPMLYLFVNRLPIYFLCELLLPPL